jgi:hypothetical protein
MGAHEGYFLDLDDPTVLESVRKELQYRAQYIDEHIEALENAKYVPQWMLRLEFYV